MEVKGSAIAVPPAFIEEKFGAARLKQWLSALPADSQKVFAGGVLISD